MDKLWAGILSSLYAALGFTTLRGQFLALLLFLAIIACYAHLMLSKWMRSHLKLYFCFLIWCLSNISIVQAEVVRSDDTPARRVVRKSGVPRRVGKNTQGRAISSAPIYGSMMKTAQNSCHCKPIKMGTWGGRPNASCHPSGRAIDVMSASCKGKTVTPLTAGFNAFVVCMERAGWFKMYNGDCVKGLPRNKTTCHKDHAHFSKCCTLKGGGRSC